MHDITGLIIDIIYFLYCVAKSQNHNKWDF